MVFRVLIAAFVNYVLSVAIGTFVRLQLLLVVLVVTSLTPDLISSVDIWKFWQLLGVVDYICIP